jgi:homoserine dehydrogenase
MPHHKIALVGLGNVARSLVRLLERKRGVLKHKYNITFSVTGISTGSHGSAIDHNGLDAIEYAKAVEAGKSLESFSKISSIDNIDFIKKSGADFMFENTPVDQYTGQPAIEHIRTALEMGMHVSTANKGPVVHGFRELTALAESKGKRFLFESTVLGGAPVFSVFREAVPAAELLSFKGILNATTNIILSRMERGESYEGAVKFCQSIGVAETDPTNDVDGWDASIKVAALITVLMDTPFTPQQVDRTGIRGLTPEMIQSATNAGRRYKLVCSAERVGDKITARVAPELVDASSPLYGMMDSSTGVTFRTDVLPDYSISVSEREGMRGGPQETAYGLFADFVNTVK